MLDTEGINVYRKEVINQTRANYKKLHSCVVVVEMKLKFS